jgi:hypothetical protein
MINLSGTTSNLYQFLLMFILIGIASCHSTEKGQSSSYTRKNNDENKSSHQSQAPDNRKEKNSNIFFSLEKTPCYGKCPVYKFIIYQDGTAKYKGKQFVEKAGAFRSENVQEEKKAIADFAKTINYFELAGKYPENKTAPSDFSQTITYLSTKKKSHKVVNKGMGAPEKLKKFESYTDSILKQVDWQEVD